MDKNTPVISKPNHKYIWTWIHSLNTQDGVVNPTIPDLLNAASNDLMLKETTVRKYLSELMTIGMVRKTKEGTLAATKMPFDAQRIADFQRGISFQKEDSKTAKEKFESSTNAILTQSVRLVVDGTKTSTIIDRMLRNTGLDEKKANNRYVAAVAVEFSETPEQAERLLSRMAAVLN